MSGVIVACSLESARPKASRTSTRRRIVSAITFVRQVGILSKLAPPPALVRLLLSTSYRGDRERRVPGHWRIAGVHARKAHTERRGRDNVNTSVPRRIASLHRN